jgi:hypothetical protein
MASECGRATMTGDPDAGREGRTEDALRADLRAPRRRPSCGSSHTKSALATLISAGVALAAAVPIPR